MSGHGGGIDIYVGQLIKRRTNYVTQICEETRVSYLK